MSLPIAVDARGGVTVIRLERPETQNALSAELLSALSDALVVGERDGRNKAFVIVGSPGVFSTGTDLRELLDYVDGRRIDESIIRFMKTIATIEKPLIAAVDGLALGLGSHLLMHCDYVVASEWSAFESTCTELGLVPCAAATLLAPRLMGYQRAFEYLVLGERFDVERALAVGLVNRIVPAAEVEQEAVKVARRLISLPDESVGQTRRLMRGDRREVLTRIDQELTQILARLRSPLVRDAVVAYMRKGF
ncbi:enoyl-CoA hydratase-related protein [Kaistia adipata]|uniref:enoyl-CoA hydratase-related protein n=1 Tax=Kaistia adipata TaxID=166954 RepID=UPI00055E3158|nr:enoyl-CoA hydratase-related protein [Kaistia adipata]